MAMRDRWLLLAPSALAAGAVLTIYADTGALLYEVIRPLALFVAAAAVVTLVAFAGTRSVTKATGLGLLLVGGVFAPLGVLLVALILLAIHRAAILRGRVGSRRSVRWRRSR